MTEPKHRPREQRGLRAPFSERQAETGPDAANFARAEEALYEAHQRYQRLVDHLPVCVHEFDLDGCIVSMNRTGVRMLGFDGLSDVVGRNLREIVGAGERARIEQHWDRAVNGQPAEFAFTYHGPRGERDFASSFVPVRDERGAIVRILGVTRDDTERNRLEAELVAHRVRLEELVQERTAELAEAQKRAESASRAKNEFLSVMSHEIRTPLHAITGFTNLLLETGPSPKQVEWLKRVEEASAYLLTIISNVLDLSKIEAGKLTLNRADFRLSALLEDVVAPFREEAGTRGLSIAVEHAGVPDRLMGDATRLGQALLNYLSNAVKFSDHGTITVRVGVAEQSTQQVLLRFEVEDEGIGIDAALLPGLFRAFEQVDVSTTRPYGGTGLGLTVTRQLALMMGGEAGAESEPGKGSRFWFTARLARNEGPVARHDEAAGAGAEYGVGRGPARILLAEDNDINRQVAVALLGGKGMTVDTAGTGREALERLRDGHYDLVLMDVRMPEMDGLEATRRIRATEGLADIPIVAMTANAFAEDRAACLEAGMNDFIAKPFKAQALLSRIAYWLSRRD